MTRDEAITWAANNIAEAMEYEYYIDNALANHAAQALTLLQGHHWMVNERHDELGHSKFWVIRSLVP